MIFSFAWRNIIRNWHRSFVTVAAVATGLSALIFLWGFNDGVHNAMMRNLQQVIVGSIQIHHVDYFKKSSLSRHMQATPELQEALAKVQHSGQIKALSWRLDTFALAAGDDVSEGLVLLGMDAKAEAKTTRIAQKVDKGRFLQVGDGAVCVLGATAARNLGVGLGDDVIFLTQDRFGALAADKFELIGIISSGEMGIDRGLAIVPLDVLQTMLEMQGRYTRVVLQIEPENLEAVTASLRKGLDDKGYEVLRWYDMYPMMKQWVDLENAFYYIFLGVVLLIVAAGIMNTVLMSMLERVREFGVMMALGCSRRILAAMVIVESMILGALGVLLGLVVGLTLVAWFHLVGIDLSAQMDTIARFYVDPIVYTEIDSDHLWQTAGSVMAAAIVAAFVPIWRVAKLQPVEAIHHV
ncbi:MAG: ABC transporter permease [Mariprofundaceae bacterium]|nr:ABC transporter permease [Mariprofundaceae bacterium]